MFQLWHLLYVEEALTEAPTFSWRELAVRRELRAARGRVDRRRRSGASGTTTARSTPFRPAVLQRALGRRDRRAGRLPRLGLEGKRVLDFGSGHGDLLAHLFRRGISAHGLEFSPAAPRPRAHASRRRLSFWGSRRRTICRRPSRTARSTSSSSSKWSSTCSTSQLVPTMRELSRLLAPGGHVRRDDAERGGARASSRFTVPTAARPFTAGSTSARSPLTRSPTLFCGFEVVRVEAVDWGGVRRSVVAAAASDRRRYAAPALRRVVVPRRRAANGRAKQCAPARGAPRAAWRR